MEYNRIISFVCDWIICVLYVFDVINICCYFCMFIVVCDWMDDVLGGVYLGIFEKNVWFYDNFFSDFGMFFLFFFLFFNVWFNFCFI